MCTCWWGGKAWRVPAEARDTKSNPLEQELEAAVKCLSSTTAARALSH